MAKQNEKELTRLPEKESNSSGTCGAIKIISKQTVKAYFSLADIVKYMKIKKQRSNAKKLGLFLHDFLVLNIYRNFYSSIASSVLLPESREFKSSASLFIQNLKSMRLLRFSSRVLPKLLTV